MVAQQEPHAAGSLAHPQRGVLAPGDELDRVRRDQRAGERSPLDAATVAYLPRSVRRPVQLQRQGDGGGRAIDDRDRLAVWDARLYPREQQFANRISQLAERGDVPRPAPAPGGGEPMSAEPGAQRGRPIQLVDRAPRGVTTGVRERQRQVLVLTGSRTRITVSRHLNHDNIAHG